MGQCLASPKALRDRLTSIAINPRPMVKVGDCYVPEPRRPGPGFDMAIEA